MKNIDSELSRILAQEPVPSENGWLARYALDAQFAGFAGHFPGYPVLPAFIQVRMAVHLLSRALGAEQALKGIGTAKFTGQARPGDVLTVECSPVDLFSARASGGRARLGGRAEAARQAGVTGQDCTDGPGCTAGPGGQIAQAGQIGQTGQIAAGLEEQVWDCAIFSGSVQPERAGQTKVAKVSKTAQQTQPAEQGRQPGQPEQSGQTGQVARFRIYLCARMAE